jgi:hypothetical protein
MPATGHWCCAGEGGVAVDGWLSAVDLCRVGCASAPCQHAGMLPHWLVPVAVEGVVFILAATSPVSTHASLTTRHLTTYRQPSHEHGVIWPPPGHPSARDRPFAHACVSSVYLTACGGYGR